MAQNGYLVYGAARRMEKMNELQTYGIRPIGLDVTNGELLTSCVEQIFKEAGSIDILLSNAGFGQEGAIDDSRFRISRRGYFHYRQVPGL